MGSLTFQRGCRILLDSNILIYYVEGIVPQADVLGPVFDHFRDGHHSAVVSGISLTEILVKPMREGDESLVGHYRGLIVNSRDIDLCAISIEVLDRAARVRAEHGLHTPDAIQVATAQVSGCDVLLTNDRRLSVVDSPAVVILSDCL